MKRARIEPREPIARRGSGDAFLAGYIAARYEGARSTSACASASPAGRSRPGASEPV